MKRAQFWELWEAGAEIYDRGVNQQQHALQVATTAMHVTGDKEWAVAGLVHDLFKPIDLVDHGELATAVFPLLPARQLQAIRHHSGMAAWLRNSMRGTRPPGLVSFGVWDVAGFELDVDPWLLERFLPMLERHLED